MATRQIGFDKDYAFGEVAFIKPASEEDLKHGVDAWLGGIPFAWRRRRCSVQDYGDISIRYSKASEAETEYDKLLNGSSWSQIYVFQYTDAVVVCLVSDILRCLREGRYVVRSNPDGQTKGAYIPIEDVPHLLLQLAKSQA